MRITTIFLFLLLGFAAGETAAATATASQTAASGLFAGQTAEDNTEASEAPKKRWFRRQPKAESRTGLWSLISSGTGGVIATLTLLLTGPQGLFLLGAGLAILGIALGIATMVREKGKPRSAQWKMALAAVIVGGLPLLFAGFIFLGFLLV